MTGLPVATMDLISSSCRPSKIQLRPVAHVVARPGLAGGLLVAADGQHDHVRLPGHPHRFLDQLLGPPPDRSG